MDIYDAYEVVTFWYLCPFYVSHLHPLVLD